MTEALTTIHFSFNSRDIAEEIFSEHISGGNVLSHRIAQPLFDAGLRVAGITERIGYDSGLSGEQGRAYNTFTILLQGAMEIQLGNRQQTIAPGELVWSPAGTRFRRVGKGATWWLYFDFNDIERWLPLKKSGPYIRRYEHAPLMFMHLRAVLDARYKASAEAPSLALASSRFLLDLLMSEMVATQGGHSVHTIALDELMTDIVRHPEQRWTVPGMSKQAAISTSHFSTLFKKQFGIPPLEAVIKQRMQKACDLLMHTDHSVQTTAVAVGYDSVCSFTRLFTKHVGVCPREYRKTHGRARPSES